MSLTAQRPVPPPKQAASSTSTVADHPMEPASEEPTDVHMAPLESTDLCFVEMLQANDAAMDPAPVIHPDPMDVSASPKHFASLDTPVRHSTSTHLRPTIHPPTRPTPDVPMVPVAPQPPYLFQLFAEVFRPLPYIGNLFRIIPDMGWPNSQTSIMSKGMDIFRWLFPSSTSGADTSQMTCLWPL